MSRTVVSEPWTTTRLGWLFQPVSDRGHEDEMVLSVYRDHGVIPKDSRTDNLNRTPENLSNYQLVHPGDLVVNRMKAWQGSLGVSEYQGIVSPDYEVLRPTVPEYDHRFLHKLLRSRAVIDQYALRSTGIRPSQWRLYWDEMKTIEISLPAVEKQRAIADYLDRATARIDTLVEEQQRLVHLLRERRDAEADALLGSPVQARHTTVKRVLRPLARPAVAGLGVVTAFRDGVVTLRSNRREDGYTFSNTEHGYQEIRPGDLVFHALDGFAGAVGVSDSHGNATPVYHVCEATAGDDLAYVARLLRYLGHSGFLATQAPNVRERSVDFRNWAMFGRLPLALPPVEEQRRIAAHLDEQNAKTDTLIAESERFIDLARERRSALITAAVMGQIDVREAA